MSITNNPIDVEDDQIYLWHVSLLLFLINFTQFEPFRPMFGHDQYAEIDQANQGTNLAGLNIRGLWQREDYGGNVNPIGIRS